MRSANDISASLQLNAAARSATTYPVPALHASAAPVITPKLRPRNGILRVPTHAVRGRARERRSYVRARLSLPLRVTRIAGQRNSRSALLHTGDISSSGVFFQYPQLIDPGTPIECEVLLVDRPLGHGSVRMRTLAHVVRVQQVDRPGWHGLAAVFDDIGYVRDDAVYAG